MSFVGTRPEVTKYVKKYTKEMRARYIYAIKEAKDRILSEAGSCITCLIICDRICQTVKKKRKETS